MLDATDAIMFSHLYVVSIIIICIYSLSKKWDTLKLVIFCYLDIYSNVKYTVAIVRIRVYASDIVIGTELYILREANRRQWSGVA